MKAIVIRSFGGPEVLMHEEMKTPSPGPGEVLVRVHAVSVNRTLDLIVREGRYAVPVALPHILGVDPSGEIVAVGEGVSQRQIGARVVSMPWRNRATGQMEVPGVQRPGGYADYVCLPEAAVVPIPDGLGYAQATVVTRHAPQAFNLLRDRAQLKPGETVLIMGAAGGLGSAGVQVARHLGGKVIAAAGSSERVAAAIRLGADSGIDYRHANLTEEVLTLTDGRGVDVVFENIADPVLFPQAFAALARHGRLVTAGSHGGGKVMLDVTRLYLFQLSVLGSLGCQRQDIESSLQLAASGRFEALIDCIMPLDQAVHAHRRVAAGEGIGKVVLAPQGTA